MSHRVQHLTWKYLKENLFEKKKGGCGISTENVDKDRT